MGLKEGRRTCPGSARCEPSSCVAALGRGGWGRKRRGRLVHALVKQAQRKVSELLHAQCDENAMILTLILRYIARLHM